MAKPYCFLSSFDVSGFLNQKNSVHDSFFNNSFKMMDRKSELTKKRKMRCGNCDKCMKVDCDYCTGCQRMTKFGGTGRPTELSTSSLPIISQSLSSKLPEKSSFSTLNVTLCLVSTLSFTWTWLRSRYSWQLFKNSK